MSNEIELFFFLFLYAFRGKLVFEINYLLIFFLFSGLSSATIRNVSLQVDPPSVRRGQHATFICSYELDGAPLYSVKFYRGMHEFYRYSPSELPTSKVFQYPGFNIDVSFIKIQQHFILLLKVISILNFILISKRNLNKNK